MEVANDVVAHLARDPLRNIVLLKHLEAFPDHTQVHRISDGARTATLVLLDVAASAYDRSTYPGASVAAMVSSDGADLTHRLLDQVPRDVGIVFKLASEADHEVVVAHFSTRRTTSVLSFTGTAAFRPDEETRITIAPSDAVFALFASQGHPRDWLAPLLAANRAFACVQERAGTPLSACFAFANYRQVWEVGGVITPREWRGRGYAARVVRTALAELSRRRRVPRYQVHDDNKPSILLAESVGLTRFLTITHFLHLPNQG